MMEHSATPLVFFFKWTLHLDRFCPILSITKTEETPITGSPSQSNQGRKRKRRQNWEKEVKCAISDDMILCIGNPKTPPPKLIDLINTFGKL